MTQPETLWEVPTGRSVLSFSSSPPKTLLIKCVMNRNAPDPGRPGWPPRKGPKVCDTASHQHESRRLSSRLVRERDINLSAVYQRIRLSKF